MAELLVRADRWTSPRPDHSVEALELAAAEVAPALRLAPVTAKFRVARAERVAAGLPGTRAALAAGTIDLGRMLAIDEATMHLSTADATAVEQLVLPNAENQTAAGELRAALRAALIAVDPDAAETRRAGAVTARSVSRYTRQDGMSAIEAVLSAVDTGDIYELVDDIARALKTTGDTRTMDARRADALVFLILGRDPHLGPGHSHEAPSDDEPPLPSDDQLPIDDDPPPPWTPDTSEPDLPSDTPDDGDPHEPDDVLDPTTHDPTSDNPGPDGPISAPTRTSSTSRPLAAFRLSWPSARPPNARRSGSPRQSMTVGSILRSGRPLTVRTSGGCRGRTSHPISTTGSRRQPWPTHRLLPQRSGLPAARCPNSCPCAWPRSPRAAHAHVHDPGSRSQNGRHPPATVTLAHLHGEGPVTVEYARYLLAVGAAVPPPPDPIDLPLTDKQRQTHDPPPALAAAIHARDGTCRSPGFRRASHRCDNDHTIRFPDGPTAPDNLSALCRRHHLLKHHGGWRRSQDDDAVLTWTTPTGHTYATHPRGHGFTWKGTTTLSAETGEREAA